jgi:hypothetical protein
MGEYRGWDVESPLGRGSARRTSGRGLCAGWGVTITTHRAGPQIHDSPPHSELVGVRRMRPDSPGALDSCARSGLTVVPSLAVAPSPRTGRLGCSAGMRQPHGPEPAGWPSVGRRVRRRGGCSRAGPLARLDGRQERPQPRGRERRVRLFGAAGKWATMPTVAGSDPARPGESVEVAFCSGVSSHSMRGRRRGTPTGLESI